MEDFDKLFKTQKMKGLSRRNFLYICIVLSILLYAEVVHCIAEENSHLEGVMEIRYFSTGDSTRQPALFYMPKTKKPVPLLVSLHTWSGSYTQDTYKPYAKWCIAKEWALIQPHYRGHNKRPEACGSELVIADILSAVEFVKRHVNVDPNRIYLVGSSGGGYTALLMAARSPDIWAGVSSWVPISDIKAWYYECKQLGCEEHAKDIVKSCGGIPGQSPAIDLQYKNRSPITYLNQKLNVALDINAGIRDGHHSGGVPVSHSLIAFNLLAAADDRISEPDIQYFTEKAEVPPHLKQKISDPAYGKKVPLFRKTSGKARITIFDGGHEVIEEAALEWLSKQKK